MLASVTTLVEERHLCQGWRIALLAACLGLSGCTGWNLRGDGFHEDELTTSTRQLRSSQDSGEVFSFSNKARQIERDFGYH